VLAPVLEAAEVGTVLSELALELELVVVAAGTFFTPVRFSE